LLEVVCNMIKVRQIKVEVTEDNETTKLEALLKKIKLKKEDVIDFKISKQSLDARDKNNIFYVYEMIVDIKDELTFLKRNKNNNISEYIEENYNFEKVGTRDVKNNIVVVGAGPAGLFAAYILSENGYHPIIVERGKKVEERIIDVENFWKTSKLLLNSNVQFGEGGAGTFSDGKLNTLIKDKNNRMKKVFHTFVECGAPTDILYSYKPHIGTDKLREVIKNLRNKIIENGGKFLYETTLTNIVVENNELKKIIVNNQDEILCDALILAIGHSARDTFEMLYQNNIEIINKPFAVGLRMEHKQRMIDEAQYGKKYANILSKSTYKLTHQTSSKRGVYTFCMCPGGFVVNASSEDKRLVVNGMSNHDRDEENANSAVIVTVDEKDYGTNILDGMKFQRMLEEKAYHLCGGKIPVQLYKDYKNNHQSYEFKDIKPIVKGNYDFANLNELFSLDINDSLKEAIDIFGKKIKGFNNDDAILIGVESRTSSPVKILRDEHFESNIKGIFPCGEGAGYAGGITSSAIDGIKVAEAIGKIYK